MKHLSQEPRQPVVAQVRRARDQLGAAADAALRLRPISFRSAVWAGDLIQALRLRAVARRVTESTTQSFGAARRSIATGARTTRRPIATMKTEDARDAGKRRPLREVTPGVRNDYTSDMRWAPLAVLAAACQPAASPEPRTARPPMVQTVPAPPASADADAPMQKQRCDPPPYYAATCPKGWGVCTICNPTGVGRRLVANHGGVPFCTATGKPIESVTRDARGFVIERTHIEDDVFRGVRYQRSADHTLRNVRVRHGNSVTAFRYAGGRLVEQKKWKKCRVARTYVCDHERFQKTTWKYDKTGRLLTLEKGKLKTTYSYDANGRLQQTSNANTKTTIEYDDRGRVIRVRYTSSGVPLRGAPPSTSFTYADGFVAQTDSFAVMGGGQTTLDFDTGGRLRHIDMRAHHGRELKFNSNGRVVFDKTHREAERFSLNAWGGWLSGASDGATREREYDEWGGLIRLTTTGLGDATDVYRWDWSKSGRMLSVDRFSRRQKYDSTCLDELAKSAPPRPSGTFDSGMVWDGVRLETVPARWYAEATLRELPAGYRITPRGTIVSEPIRPLELLEIDPGAG